MVRAAGAPSAARRRELCELTRKKIGFGLVRLADFTAKNSDPHGHRAHRVREARRPTWARRTAHALVARDAAKLRRKPLTACSPVLWRRCEPPAGAAASADTFPAAALPCSSRQRHRPLRSLRPLTLLVSQGS